MKCSMELNLKCKFDLMWLRDPSCIDMSSVESQKGLLQLCSIENQKGASSVQIGNSALSIGSQWNIFDLQ